MTEKQYKLERWTDTSLYYSFPDGSVHQGIGYVIEKVEKDLNKLAEENEQLKSENKRLTDKLNKIALELVEDVISQGKAVEISEMSYNEFLDYRAKNGKPMELQL
jgi:predicted HTH domain antitoxin